MIYFLLKILMISNNEIKFIVKKYNAYSSFFSLPYLSSKDIGSYNVDLQFMSTPYLIQLVDFKSLHLQNHLTLMEY